MQAGQGRFGTFMDGARPLSGGPSPVSGTALGWRGELDDGSTLLARFEPGACTSPLLRGPAEHQGVLVVDGAVRLDGCCRVASTAAPLAADASATPTPQTAHARVRPGPGSLANVRGQPYIAVSNVVAQLPEGAPVEVAGAETHAGELWYRVRFDGGAGSGWIRGDLLETAPASPEAARAFWAMRAELLPAIDRCLARIAARPALVTLAHAEAGDGFEVRLMDADGRRWACTGDGAEGTALTLIPSDDRAPAEFRPLFLRAPHAPTRDPCYRHEAVHDGGQLAGWLSFGLCS